MSLARVWSSPEVLIVLFRSVARLAVGLQAVAGKTCIYTHDNNVGSHSLNISLPHLHMDEKSMLCLGRHVLPGLPAPGVRTAQEPQHPSMDAREGYHHKRPPNEDA